MLVAWFPDVSFANIEKLWRPLARPRRESVPVVPDVEDVRFSYVPLGKPIWIWEKDGLASVKVKARSRVLFVESVLFDFVGEMNLKADGEVVSIFIL